MVCGVETAKPLWVREHSCPACGHTEDCDLNAAKNILFCGLRQIGGDAPNQRLWRPRSLRSHLSERLWMHSVFARLRLTASLK